MYYEERIIDGVLCWRGAPDGRWAEKTPAQLTAMLIEARRGRDGVGWIGEIRPPYIATC